MIRSRILGMAALLAGIGGVEVLPSPPREPEAKPPKAHDEPREARPFDAPRWARKKKEKAEKERRRKLRKGGISGAGLWRKCGGRVRGW